YLNCLKITQGAGGGSTNNPSAPPPASTVLVDFGNNQSFRGTNTPSPDAQGHYWNSVWSGQFYASLTNAAGSPTTMALGFDSAGGNDSYNGPAGDTSIPGGNLTGCVFNATALGYLGITNAVYDFYVSSDFQLQGLSPAKSYSLT